MLRGVDFPFPPFFIQIYGLDHLAPGFSAWILAALTKKYHPFDLSFRGEALHRHYFFGRTPIDISSLLLIKMHLYDTDGKSTIRGSHHPVQMTLHLFHRNRLERASSWTRQSQQIVDPFWVALKELIKEVVRLHTTLACPTMGC